MKEKFINKIEEFIHISHEEEKLIEEYAKLKKYHALEHIQWFGGETAYFVYVIKGMVHAYYVDDEGKHITTNVVVEDQFISPTLSFISGEPSREYLQCLEDTEILTFSRTRMNDLYNSVQNWNKLGRLFSEYNYTLMAERVLPKVHSDQERFLGFFETVPKSIFERAPIQVLASFLEIHEDKLQRLIDKYDI